MARTCDCCGAPSNGYECDWPIIAFVPVSVSILTIGDTIQRLKQTRETTSIAKVAMIDPIGKGEVQSFAITLAIQTPKSIRRANIRSGLKRGPLKFDDSRTAMLTAWQADRFKRFYAAEDHVVKALRSHACSKHVCDACMVERDPNRMVICRHHWFAWETVA